MNDRDMLHCQAEGCSNTYGIEDSDARSATRFCSVECEDNIAPSLARLVIATPSPLRNDARLERDTLRVLGELAKAESLGEVFLGLVRPLHARWVAAAGPVPADRWAGQSPSFRDEHPWCGWTLAFAADSDWDTTQFGLEKLIGINVLLTTADGRSRPVRITEWQRVIREDVAGIVVRELETTTYKPIPGGAEEDIRYEDIREIVVF